MGDELNKNTPDILKIEGFTLKVLSIIHTQILSGVCNVVPVVITADKTICGPDTCLFIHRISP